ncbi:hypothetical protein EDE15_1635 [Edaphobacter aggregans]|uniref:Uncharacterized protein n=1 Tax=Edaphobacter aggregans TaxID=570835 RepID=A0A428MGT2_9BACT|nr:hypothetical protein EDE15_1635 [Edaphobacter aggregans]
MSSTWRSHFPHVTFSDTELNITQHRLSHQCDLESSNYDIHLAYGCGLTLCRVSVGHKESESLIEQIILQRFGGLSAIFWSNPFGHCNSYLIGSMYLKL